MNDLKPLEELAIYAAATVGWLPASGVALCLIDTVYSAVKTPVDKIFFNSENLSFKELYCKNFREFFYGKEEVKQNNKS